MRGSRRKAREDALKILYQLDLNETLTPDSAIQHFETNFSESGKLDDFSRELVLGVLEHLIRIDETVKKVSEHWRKERMGILDLNILRIGVFEFFHRKDIPLTITINEMIELGKTFGSENTPKFINGILDQISRGVNDPDKAK